MACAHTDDLPLQPPNGIGDQEQYHDTCIWHNLKAVELEVCLHAIIVDHTHTHNRLDYSSGCISHNQSQCSFL